MVDGGTLVATVDVGRVVVVARVPERTVVVGPGADVVVGVAAGPDPDADEPPDEVEAGTTAARVADGMSSAPTTTATITSSEPRTAPDRSKGPNMSANSGSGVWSLMAGGRSSLVAAHRCWLSGTAAPSKRWRRRAVRRRR